MPDGTGIEPRERLDTGEYYERIKRRWAHHDRRKHPYPRRNGGRERGQDSVWLQQIHHGRGGLRRSRSNGWWDTDAPLPPARPCFSHR